MKKIDQKYISNSITYVEYRSMIDDLLVQQKTTGDNHSEAMIHYTKMNVTRMNRLDKTTKLTDELLSALKNVTQEQTWLILTEAWCGDAAQIIPVLHKMEEVTSKIELRFILRDQNLELMDQYLTNGGRSIPKVISLKKDNGEELFNWGPRPALTQEIFLDLKSKHEDYMDVAEGLHKWYAKNKTAEIQKEFAAILSNM